MLLAALGALGTLLAYFFHSAMHRDLTQEYPPGYGLRVFVNIVIAYLFAWCAWAILLIVFGALHG